MSPAAARTTANLVIAGAVGAAAFVVLRNPKWRHVAGRVLWGGLTKTLPGWLFLQAREAWEATNPGTGVRRTAA